MKLFIIFLSAIILSCSLGHCGVISDVYDKAIEAKNGVADWVSHKKDKTLGNVAVISGKSLGESEDESDPNSGMISSIYNGLLNSVQTASNSLYGYFVGEENKDNGFINTMYDKVKNRITAITAYVVGEENMDTPTDLSEVRRALNTIINKHKHDHQGGLDGEVETLKDKIKEAGEKIQDSVDEDKDNVDDMNTAVVDNVSSGVNSATEIVNEGIKDAKNKLSLTFDSLQQSGIEISEKEKEVLDAIANRIKDKLANVKESEDSKKMR